MIFEDEDTGAHLGESGSEIVPAKDDIITIDGTVYEVKKVIYSYEATEDFDSIAGHPDPEGSVYETPLRFTGTRIIVKE